MRRKIAREFYNIFGMRTAEFQFRCSFFLKKFQKLFEGILKEISNKKEKSRKTEKKKRRERAHNG